MGNALKHCHIGSRKFRRREGIANDAVAEQKFVPDRGSEISAGGAGVVGIECEADLAILIRFP